MSAEAPPVPEPERGVDGDRGDGEIRAYYQNTIRLPGYGKSPQRCLPYQPVGFCEEHGHPVLGRSSCGTRRCPDHWRDWVERAVANLTARLAAYRHAQEGAGKRLVHGVASPPQDRRWTEEAFWNARSEAYDAAKQAGVRGGVAVAHPYRASEAGEEFFSTAVEAGDWEKDRGKWSLFRDAADDWEELGEYVEAGPHVHLLAAAEDVDGAAAPKGWVVENIRSLPRFHYRDVESYRPMARVAWYLLTHAAVQKGRDTITYFGAIHPAAFDPAEELTAGEWERIQINAGKALTTEPGGAPIDDGVEDMECPRDGCESGVVPLDRLREYLADGAWLRSIRRRERRQLKMMVVWSLEEADRPPPSALSSEAGVLNWLDEQGRVYFQHSKQVGVSGFRADG